MILKSETKYVEYLPSENPRACLIVLQTDVDDANEVFEEALDAATQVFAERGLKCRAASTDIRLEKPRESWQSVIRLDCRQEQHSPLTMIKYRRGEEPL